MYVIKEKQTHRTNSWLLWGEGRGEGELGMDKIETTMYKINK